MTKPERSASDQPLADKLVSGHDVPEQPGTHQPGIARDVPAGAAADQPLSGGAVPDRAAAGEPLTGRDVPERAVPDQSVAGRAVAPDQTLPDQPGTGKHLTGRSAAGQPVSERSLSGSGHPVAEQPAAEGRVPEQAGRRAAAESGAVDDGAVLPPHEREKLELRLHHAVGGFVDEPRAAVEEAASAVDALTERIIETLGQRRGTLRASWQDASGGSATEDLRMALREYRRLAERLLSL
ncbi:hypothetical protein GCM10010331_55260 [Streptomyces xanthochromogenes]|uniref:hypothetical protein n=1 Tax=Streptomyces xanthochromogenes TaxID=67384 RepID=UPI0019CB2C14|nr:hypothetical protein [Streptomyces xanthochromogenes]GHB60510.1 hypothetical protein GCM10010331_55260 [Streptomyces xanthochromogenes]